MWKLNSLIVFMLISLATSAQYTWQWTELDTMPVRISNNAVCEAIVGGNEFVYSFGGIDPTKIYSGINNRSFKYEVAAGNWTEISPLPNTITNIAAGASFVKDKIYILGGYSVYSNNNEISSDKVHIYDPSIDAYLTDGTPIPLAIDDHVQCVYKDSLIFVVTGWSNTGNKPNVQIYDPTLDQWQVGTPVPNNFNYTSFGSSGYILGDTLYYHGGAAGGSFAARTFMRKGYINPLDPTDIIWEQMANAPGAAGYRSACSGVGNTVFWIGGAPTSYNFDGISYNGSGGVNPSARILHFNNWNYQLTDNISEPYGVMDLRGIAKFLNGRWIICGGMDTNQIVSNRTFLLENTTVSINEDHTESFDIRYLDNQVIVNVEKEGKAILVDMNGRQVKKWILAKEFVILKQDFKAGIYLLKYKKSILRISL